VVIVHKNDPAAKELADRTEADIAGRCRVHRDVSSGGPGESRVAPPSNFKPELVVSLGGDGTIIHAARTWGLRGAPIMGVNLGRVGFLAEIEPERLREVLEAALGGQALVEERTVLDFSINRDGRTVHESTAVNDAVINKRAMSRIVSLKLSVAGKDFWTYRADGLILATPTGSTAYNLSAGGPVVHPILPAVVVTPICPFTLATRSVILPLDFNVEVVIDEKDADVILTADGQSCFPLQTGDRVKITKSAAVVKLIKNHHRHYLDTLRVKLGLFSDKPA
jgi:NAD+ kinase